MGRPDQVTVIVRRLLLVIAIVIAIGVWWAVQVYRAQEQFREFSDMSFVRMACALETSRTPTPHAAAANRRKGPRLTDDEARRLMDAMMPAGVGSARPSPAFLRCMKRERARHIHVRDMFDQMGNGR
jgi:hypothetical protein